MAQRPKRRLVDVVAIGRQGGLATAAKLTKEELSERGRHAVEARWKAYRKAKRKAAA